VSYHRLEREQASAKRAVDHTARWATLEPVATVNGQTEERLRAFCEAKRITIEALSALDTRVAVRKGGRVELAFAGENHAGAITAIKYRPLDGTSHDSTAEPPSVWVRPIIAGRRDALDWFIAEGETDAARLVELVGDRAAVMVLPAGARTFRSEWAALIPRGATVALAHDADQHGDDGAEKAARILGGRTLRLRPPIEGADWCEWPGGRDELLELIRGNRPVGYQFTNLETFLAHPYPKAEALLGEPGAIYLARGSLLMVYGADGSGKSTWTIDGVAHLASGRDWLGIRVPRPVRVAMIEVEGPPSLFQNKLAAKTASWDGPEFAENVYVFAGPWGEFTFSDPDARATLREFCDQHDIDVVTANPTLGLGVAASGRPDETQQFVDWLVECGLKGERAFWLLHHENKAGQISGDWGRHPDTKVQLQADGKQPRTKLEWAKTRWATLPSETQLKSCLLEWIIEAQGYRVIELDTVGATDSELEERMIDYLTEHPLSSTTAVETNVTGTASRIRALLDGPRFDSVPGKRGARMWFLATTPSASADDGVTE
jgi:hypothetical protein